MSALEQYIYNLRKNATKWQAARGKTIFDGLIKSVDQAEIVSQIDVHTNNITLVNFSLEELREIWLKETKGFHYDPVTVSEVYSFLTLYLKYFKPAYSIQPNFKGSSYFLVYTVPELTAADLAN